MRRRRDTPRPDAAERHAAIGFGFSEIGGEPYWDETAHWEFTLREIEDGIEDPTTELWALCLDLVDRVITDETLLARLKIPENAWDGIAASRRAGEPSLYGRFDLSWEGRGPAKLLEFNADTPTSLFESAVVQWTWLEDGLARGTLPKGADQYNSIHERLIARLPQVSRGRRFHLTAMTASPEDTGTIAYLADCAIAAGLEAEILDIADVGLRDGHFVDLDDRPIETLFKLYPWEWLLAEDFGRSPAMAATRFVEPAWKAILADKGAMALLWDQEPGHPNLLPTFFDDDPRRESLTSYAVKPLFSREGGNVMLIDRGRLLARTEGSYGAEGSVVQQLAPLPDVDGNHMVIGSWIVGDAACGIGLREDAGPVTTDRSRFLPHVIVD